jgi:SAM-dependent methyltransferase
LITDPVDPWVDAVDGELKGAGFSAATILDAGCGTGRHAEKLIEHGHTLTLMDASSALLRIASRRCPDAQIRLGDICAPDVTQEFDAVTCRGVLNDLTEVDERAAAMDSFAAQIRRGGLLLLDVRETAGSRRRADGRWRTTEGRLADGGRLRFMSRPTWRAGRIVVHERYEVMSSADDASTVHEYRFEMRPWSSEELSGRLSAAGFANVEIHPGVGRRTPDRLFVVAQR